MIIDFEQLSERDIATLMRLAARIEALERECCRLAQRAQRRSKRPDLRVAVGGELPRADRRSRGA